MKAFILTMLLAQPAIAGPCTHDANTFRCVTVIDNHDGDTLKVDIPGAPEIIGKSVGVRVRGIDTPEMHGKGKCERLMAGLAKARVKLLLHGAKRIDLERVARDKYFRILADVSVDGKSLAGILIKEGLAVPYDGGTKAKRSWCESVK